VVARRSGLGKGLGALIPSELSSDAQASVLREIPVSQIDPNSHQPRAFFDEESLVALTASVRELGVLQPVLVRPSGPERFELIAGERRWRAAKRAGLHSIPALIRTVEDGASIEHALVENLHREDLNPLEEAGAYQQLIEDFGMTHDDLARRMGRSRSAVTNTLRLFQLPPGIQKLVAEGQLSSGHARALLGTPDRSFQDALARRAVSQNLSVREVEEAVRDRQEEVAPPRARRRPSGPADRPAGLLELEELLSSRLDTSVTVTMNAKRGRVVIDFASLEDLERIYQAMASSEEPAQ